MFYRFKTHLEIEYLRKELAFETTEDILKFLVKLGVQGILDRQSLDTRIALPGLNESAKKFMKVDINRSVVTV